MINSREKVRILKLHSNHSRFRGHLELLRGIGQILHGLLSTPQGCSPSVELALACSWISGSEKDPCHPQFTRTARTSDLQCDLNLKTFWLVSKSPIYEKVHLCPSDHI